MKKKHTWRAKNILTEKSRKHYSTIKVVLEKAIFFIRYAFIRLKRIIVDIIDEMILDIKPKYLIFLILAYTIISAILFLTIYNVWVQSYKNVKLPLMEGNYVLESLVMLQQLNLRPRIELRYSSQPYGFIIKQDPKAGQVIKENRRVWLIVSRGPEVKQLDDFKGKKIYYVEKRLQELSSTLGRQITVGSITYIYTDMYEKDTVVSQNTIPSSDLVYVTSVDLVVSKGAVPSNLIVKSYVGLDEVEAKKLLSSEGFIIQVNYQIVEDVEKMGKVLEQSLQPGAIANKGDTIVLTIGKRQDL